jgi:hypothetical protein
LLLSVDELADIDIYRQLVRGIDADDLGVDGGGTALTGDGNPLVPVRDEEDPAYLIDGDGWEVRYLRKGEAEPMEPLAKMPPLGSERRSNSWERSTEPTMRWIGIALIPT